MSEPSIKTNLKEIISLLKELDDAPFLPENSVGKEIESLRDYITEYKDNHLPLERAFEKENGYSLNKIMFEDADRENPFYILMDKYAYQKLIWEYTARILYTILTKKEE